MKSLTIRDIKHLSFKTQLQELGKPNLTTINTKPPHAAHKTFGICKTKIADGSTHIKTLVNHSLYIAAIFGPTGTHPYQVEVAAPMISTLAMGQSLPAVNFSENDINKIQNKGCKESRWQRVITREHPKESCRDHKNLEALVPHMYIWNTGLNRS
jgi:hypothetical protein